MQPAPFPEETSLFPGLIYVVFCNHTKLHFEDLLHRFVYELDCEGRNSKMRLFVNQTGSRYLSPKSSSFPCYSPCVEKVMGSVNGCYRLAVAPLTTLGDKKVRARVC